MSESDSQSLDMSSDKNLIPKCVSKNSHSFDDRICDDFSEVLLQFLSLEDKLRFECVSKQFQSTVFRKQYKITFVSYLKMNTKNKISEEIEEKDYDNHYLKFIESLLKKCPNIQIMFIFAKHNRIFKSILPLITKNIKHLIEFNVYLNDFSEPELSEEFLQKFGPKLKYIQSGNIIDFNLFPNLNSLDKYNKFKFKGSFLLENTHRLNLKNLKELNITLTEQNIHLFGEVLQKFHKIRHLGLYFFYDLQNLVYNAFRKSPILQNLIEIKYDTNMWYRTQYANQTLDSIKQLVEKFPKLKSIEIKSVFVKDFSDLRQQLSPLKAFLGLKRIDLRLYFQHEKEHGNFSLKQFEELSNITHLKLWFGVKQLNEKLLKDIDIYLPKLQYLFIRPEIITDEEGVKQMAESLSRLSSLETIDLWLKYEHISELMTTKIAEKCRKIRNNFINEIIEID